MNKEKILAVLIFLSASVFSFAEQDYNNEASDDRIIKETFADIDNDGIKEIVKAIWGYGVSDKPLKIEIFKNEEIADTVHAEFGIQSNYSLKDTDKDGTSELIIWSGIWDFRLPGEDGITEDTYEGHSGSHRYVVATYKWLRGEYYFWDVYTTKKKYPAWIEEIPGEIKHKGKYMKILFAFFTIAGTLLLSKDVFKNRVLKLINIDYERLPLIFKLTIKLFGWERKFKDKRLWSGEDYPTSENFTLRKELPLFIGFTLILLGTIGMLFF